MGNNSFTFNFRKIPKDFVFFLTLAFCFEWGICHFNHMPDYALKKELIETERIEADVLFLGDSSVTSNVDAALFEERTRLTMYGLGTLRWLGVPSYYLLLQDYLKHQPAPRYLVLMMTPSVWSQDFGNYCVYFEAYFNRSLLLFEILGRGLSPVLFFHYAVLDWLPSIRYRSYLQDIPFPKRRALLEQEAMHMRNARVSLIRQKGTSLMDKGRHTVKCSPIIATYEVNPVHQHYLQKILDLARARGIRVFYVATPFARECYNETQATELRLIHDEILSRNPGLESISVSELAIPKENFSNTSFHLHREAARVFTEKLAGAFIRSVHASFVRQTISRQRSSMRMGFPRNA